MINFKTMLKNDNFMINSLLYLDKNNLFKSKDIIYFKAIVQYIKSKKTLTKEQKNYLYKTLIQYDKELKHRIKIVRKDTRGARKAVIEGKSIKLIFSHPDKEIFKDIIEDIKTIYGWVYRAIGKTWRVPISIDSITHLENMGFNLDRCIEKLKNDIYINKNKQIIQYPQIKRNLYNYQKKGVLFIEQSDGNTLLADDMGIGKSIQSIAWAALHSKIRPVLILCPASLKLNWEKEIKNTIYNPTIQIIDGRSKIEVTTNDFIIINYEILKWHCKLLSQINPGIFIIDECHILRNRKGNYFKSAKTISDYSTNVIGLSGTPIINDITELWTLLRIIKPTLWPKFRAFANEYCVVKETKIKLWNRTVYNYDYTETKNEDRLNKILKQTVMIRRLKTEVLPELPEKTRTIIPVRMDSYSDYVKEFKLLNFRQSNNALKNKLEALKQLIIREKIKYIEEWIGNFLLSKKKLIVFCTHHWTVDRLLSIFPSLRLDGRDNKEAKEHAKELFQNDSKHQLIICNLKSGSLGHNLTAASDIMVTEFGWTSSEHEQAEDRAYRIGQKNAVNIWYMVALETIEIYIMSIIDRKRAITDSIINDKTSSKEDLLLDLVEKIKNNG